LVAVSGLAATARAETYLAYTGPALPRQQVAVLDFSHVKVDQVDGKSALHCEKHHWNGLENNSKYRNKCWLAFPDSIEMLPGKHTIRFQFGADPLNTLAPTAVSAQPITGDIVVEAGKTYKAQRWWRRGNFIGATRQCYDASPLSCAMTTSSTIDWGVNIIDNMHNSIPFSEHDPVASPPAPNLPTGPN
jgi:hypothetical protein